MALLRQLRNRGGGLSGTPPRIVVAGGLFPAALALFVAACDPGVPESLRPDSVLRANLGLTDDDEVHRVTLTSSETEEARPDSLEIPPGAWVEFVTADWRIHEVRFELDSLAPEAADFLRRTGQAASPPLLVRDARFVVSFADAPEARYPYAVEGNLPAVRGVVIVRPRP